MREPLLLPLVAFIAGILLAGWAEFRTPEIVFAAVWLALIAVLAAVHKSGTLRTAAVLLLVTLAGIRTADSRRPAVPDPTLVTGEVREIRGCVASPVTGPPDRRWFYLEVAPRARIRVSLSPERVSGAELIQYGRMIAAPMLVRSPVGFRNPGSFDYAAYLAVRDVFWQARIPARSRLQAAGVECGTRWQGMIYSLREASLARLDSLFANRPFERGMLKGLLLGDASEIRRVWVEDFRRTGTYHALVISGSHISFLAGLFILWLRWSRLGETWILALACITAWLYALVAGADPPVVRSAAGFTLAVSARFFYRRVRLLNVIAAVALLFLVIEPWQLYEASFQLSFLAVGAIAGIGVPLLEATSGVVRAAVRDFTGESRPLRDRRAAALRVELSLLAETISLVLRLSEKAARRLVAWTALVAVHVWELAAISAAVQLALVLPMVAYFHRLSLSGLTANIIATPLITLAIPFGFLAVLGNAQWSGEVAAALLDVSRRIVAWHASWEPAWRVPDPPLLLSLALAASVTAICVCLRFHERWGRRWAAASGAASMTAVAAIVLWTFPVQATPGTLELSAIDVGQGESLLLTLPDSRAVLVDTGGLPTFSRSAAERDDPPRLDTGEDVVSPYLWSRRFRSVDVLVLSHIHQDHAGGAPALIENFRPREVWVGKTHNSRLWHSIEATALRCGARVRRWDAGQHETLAGVGFDALTPLPDLEYASREANEDSFAFQVSFGRHRFLLTGDMDRRTERLIADSGRLGAVDVLKVGHHGSRRSSHPVFLDAVRPAIAVISAGPGNTFNHPHPDVVAALAQRRSMILRTDLEGLVTIRSDGRHLETDTMKRSGAKLLWDPF